MAGEKIGPKSTDTFQPKIRIQSYSLRLLSRDGFLKKKISGKQTDYFYIDVDKLKTKRFLKIIVLKIRKPFFNTREKSFKNDSCFQ